MTAATPPATAWKPLGATSKRVLVALTLVCWGLVVALMRLPDWEGGRRILYRWLLLGDQWIALLAFLGTVSGPFVIGLGVRGIHRWLGHPERKSRWWNWPTKCCVKLVGFGMGVTLIVGGMCIAMFHFFLAENVTADVDAPDGTSVLVSSSGYNTTVWRQRNAVTWLSEEVQLGFDPRPGPCRVTSDPLPLTLWCGPSSFILGPRP